MSKIAILDSQNTVLDIVDSLPDSFEGYYGEVDNYESCVVGETLGALVSRESKAIEMLAALTGSAAVTGVEIAATARLFGELRALLETTAQTMAETADDETITRFGAAFPTWEDFVGKELTEGTVFKFGLNAQDGTQLYRARSTHTPQAQYSPSLNTASLYEAIGLPGQGSIDNPIPYDLSMAVEQGLYYIYEDIIYRCIRSSGTPLYAAPGALLGNYFEVAA